MPLSDSQAATALRNQYAVVVESEKSCFRERVKFGVMLIEWERFLGESRGGVGGSAAGEGLKGWLAKNCPELGYASAMGYKTMAARAVQMLGGGAVVTAALLGEAEVRQPDGEVVDVPVVEKEKCEKFFAVVDSRRKLEQTWFEFAADGAAVGKRRPQGMCAGAAEDDGEPLGAAEKAHAIWSHLVIEAKRARLLRYAKLLTLKDANDALDIIQPLVDALKARKKELA